MSRSELQVSDLWDEAIESGLKRIGYGLLAGTGAAIVLARSAAVRASLIGLSVGVGIGMTYAETQSRFEALDASASPSRQDELVPSVGPPSSSRRDE